MLCIKGGIVIYCCYKKVLDVVKGYYDCCSWIFKVVCQVVDKVNQYVICDCKNCKCNFCVLWIQCINVVVCVYDEVLMYLCFINGLNLVGIEVDCKVLVDLVVYELEVFGVIVEKVKVVFV